MVIANCKTCGAGVQIKGCYWCDACLRARFSEMVTAAPNAPRCGRCVAASDRGVLLTKCPHARKAVA